MIGTKSARLMRKLTKAAIIAERVKSTVGNATFLTRPVAQHAVDRRRQSLAEEVERQKAGQQEDRIGHLAQARVLDPRLQEEPEDQAVHDHVQQRVEERPQDTQVRAPVASLEIAPDQLTEKLSITGPLGRGRCGSRTRKRAGARYVAGSHVPRV
jgi:hypothetical protein